MYRYLYGSPIGVIEIEADNNSLLSLHFMDNQNSESENTTNSIIKDVIFQLDKYFSGELKKFSISLRIEGTEFQKKVWSALKKIPYGKTRSYLDIAKEIGNKNSVRAVGNANGKNKFPILIPCHRVIYENGKLGGFSAGIWRKEFLLELENNKS